MPEDKEQPVWEFHQATVQITVKQVRGKCTEQVSVIREPSIVCFNSEEDWLSVQEKINEALAKMNEQQEKRGD